MAVGIRSVGVGYKLSGNVAATDLAAVPMPPTVSAGDVIIVFTTALKVAVASPPTCATPSGWTLLAGPKNPTIVSGHSYVFAKIAVGTEGGTTVGFVWSGLTTGASGTPSLAQAAAFTGLSSNLSTIVAIDGALSQQSASSTVAAGGAALASTASGKGVLTCSSRASTDNAEVWAVPATADGCAWTAIPPLATSGLTRVYTTSGNDGSMSWAYCEKSTTSTIAAKSWSLSVTATASQSAGFMLVLNEAGGGGPVTFEGASGAIADHAGDLDRDAGLAGAVEAIGDQAGDLTVTAGGGAVAIAGALEAVADHAGDVRVTRAFAVGLPPIDVIDAGDTSTAPTDIVDAGDTSTPPTDIIDAGVLALDIVAEHAGDLAADRTLAGASEAVAEQAGDLTVTPAAGGTVTYDAALEAVAEHAGVLDVTKGFAGASEAVADQAGVLARDRGLVGASEAVAELAGILARDRQLTGASEAVAEHAGDMSIAGQVTFVGAVEAVADHAGALRLALTIAGASEAVGEHAGLLGVTVPIAGALAAVAEHAGALDVSGFIPPFVPGWQITFNDPSQSVQLADPLQTVTLTGIEHTQLLADPTRTVALIDSDHNETFADNAHTVTLQGG